jgi:hypothetical protein
MFSCNPSAYEQHHKIFGADDSVDSAAHLSAFGSLLPLLLIDRSCDVLEEKAKPLPFASD